MNINACFMRVANNIICKQCGGFKVSKLMQYYLVVHAKLLAISSCKFIYAFYGMVYVRNCCMMMELPADIIIHNVCEAMVVIDATAILYCASCATYRLGTIGEKEFQFCISENIFQVVKKF